MYARVFVLASLLASIAAGVSIPGLPQCAGQCVGNNFGGCQQLNVKCICSNQPLLTHLACCVSKTCDKADQDKTIQFANAICEGENVTNLPQTATCASTATGSSATASSTSGTAAAATTATTSGTTAAASSSSSSSATAAAASPGAANANGIGLGMMVAGLVAAI